MRFYANDPSGYNDVRIVQCVADGTHATNDYPTRLEFHTTADSASSPTERMRIASNGDIGIGIAPAAQKLQVHESTSSTESYVHITNAVSGGTSSDGMLLGLDTSANALVWNQENTVLAFATNNTERMRITNGGLVFIGNSSPTLSGRLSLERSGFVQYNRCSGTGTGNIPLILERASDSGVAIEFKRTNNVVGSITVDSTSTAYNTSSDYRLKENVVDLDGAITRVKQLAPKRFNFIADADTTVDGFLAHEAATVVPESVTGTHNQVDDDNNPVYQGIDTSKLVPLLTAALQEEIAKREALEARISALEG